MFNITALYERNNILKLLTYTTIIITKIRMFYKVYSGRVCRKIKQY